MSMMISGDCVLESQENIEQHVLSYYTNLYCSENSCTNSDFVSNTIPNLVSMEDNLMLTNPPTMEEVKSAVFGMNGSGAPGLDGFGGCFF